MPRTFSICSVARFAATTRLRVLPDDDDRVLEQERGTEHRDDENRDRDEDLDDRETIALRT